MEFWQKKYICRHMVVLQELTNFDVTLETHLFAEELLGVSDVDILRTVRSAQGKLVQTSLLYEILKTRVNGYEKLAKALYDCKQSGALKVLLDGFREQGISHSLLKCNIPTDYLAILSAHVEFLGRNLEMKHLLPGIQVEDLHNAMDDPNVEEDYVDMFIHGNQPLVLIEKTVPMTPSFYIPRLLSNRLKLNSKVFKQECPDVFVFKGVERHALTKLAHPNNTSTSSLQIMEINSRFVFLEDEIDWDELQVLAKQRNIPAHLVKLEDGHGKGGTEGQTYILEGTTGASNILWEYVERQENTDRIYFSEDELIRILEDESPTSGLCICDTPGMGKSWLLANLARKLSDRYPERAVAFFSLGQFIPKIKEKFQQLPITKENSLNSVVSHISPTALSRAILARSIKCGSLKLELFFDGLDELNVEDLDWTKEFLQSIVTNSDGVRIYVTSRPHLRADLETTLGVIAYDILPFNENNQLKYLVNSWKTGDAKCIDSKLELFASACLQNLKGTLTMQEKDLMGIPLQCYLLAQVYQKEACLFSDPRRELQIPLLKPTTLFKMYQTFLETRIFANTGNKDDDIYIGSKHFHVWHALHLLFPELAEMYAENKMLTHFNPTDFHLRLGILQMNNCSSSMITEFVHRTLAEFLVAEYFAEILLSDNVDHATKELNTAVIKCMQDKVFRGVEGDWLQYKMDRGHIYCLRFSSPVIAYFLNELLSSATSDPASVSNQIANELFTFSHPRRFSDILQCCAFHSSIHLLRYFKYQLKTLTPQNVEVFSSYMLTQDDSRMSVGTLVEPGFRLLCIAGRFSNLLMVKEIFQFFAQAFRHDLSILCSQTGKDVITPLHWAVKKADYELVEFLSLKFSTENRSLLYWSLQESYGESTEKASKRLEICKLLLSMDSKLIYEPGVSDRSNCSGPVVAYGIHMDLLKFLIQQGADMKATKQYGNKEITVAFSAAEYMSGSDYREFCEFLCKDPEQALHILNPTFDKRMDIVPSDYVGERFLLMVLNAAGVDLNNTDTTDAALVDSTTGIMSQLLHHGYSGDILNHVVHGNLGRRLTGTTLPGREAIQNSSMSTFVHGAIILKDLHDMGLDFMKMDIDGNTFVHRLHNCLNAEEYHVAAKYLIEKGLGEAFRVKNNQGVTALHFAVNRLELLTKTLDVLIDQNSVCLGQPVGDESATVRWADVNAVDVNGESVLHWALRGKRSLGFIKRLINIGADCKIRNNHGSNMVLMSASFGLIEHLTYFVELECDINEFDNDGDNALQCVLFDSSENVAEIVKFLVAVGINKNHVNKQGKTARMIVTAKGITDETILNAVLKN